MDMLVLADQNGVVDMTHDAIARRTNVPLKIVQAAITELEQPDKRSRSSQFDGARLQRLDDHRDWGWVIVNYRHYRSIANAEAYREVNREKVQAIRDRARQPELPASPPVPPLPKAKAEAYTEAGNQVHVITGNNKFKKPSIEEVKLFCSKSGIPISDAEWFFHKCEGNGWTNGGRPIKRWGSTLSAWKSAGYLPSQKTIINGAQVQKPKTILEKEIDRL